MTQDPDDPSTSTSSPNFESIYADALEKYKKRTKKDIAAHSLAAEIKACESSDAVLAVLQTQVQRFDPSPGANERWASMLGPTITVLFALSKFAGKISGHVFPPATAIFTGIGTLLQAVKDVRATKDTLIRTFDRMKNFFMRLEKYIVVRPTPALTEVIVQVIVEVISILGIATKEIEEWRIKKFVKRLSGINRLNDAVQQLENVKAEEALMAGAETLEIAARIDQNVIGMGANMAGTSERVQGVQVTLAGMTGQLRSAQADIRGVGHEVHSIHAGVTEARGDMQVVLKYVSDLNRNESRRDLRQWIDPPDPSSNFHTASDAHHKGTSAWCTGGKTFANWMASGSLLWIHGKPGSGKTILSSVIIQHIENLPNAKSVFLAYFYFDFKDEGKKDSRALLSSLLNQLSNQSDQFRDVLRGLYSEHEDGSGKPHSNALLRCLKDMLTIARSVPIYLVMDALDECPNDSGDLPSRSPRGKVLSVVEELVKLRLPNLRLCITSRPELDIRTCLNPLAPQEISLHNEGGQNQDINSYVTFVVQLKKNWRASDKEIVISELTKNADGMFRWVYCQLVALRECLPKNLRQILKELPKSLDETYQRILKEINNANQKEAHRLLQCLAVAYRPLRIEELTEVLALDVDAGGIPKFNDNWRWEDHEAAVLSTCSSLVSVINYNGSRVVQFAHFSVKEFLTSDRLASMADIYRFHIADEPSHAILAQACLGVLLCLEVHPSEDSLKDIPLFEYAAINWVGHAQVGNVELQIKDAMDCFFDIDKPHFAASLGGVDILRVLADSWDEELTDVLSVMPLYFASGLGFSSLAERLITKRPQAINYRGPLAAGTPLHFSVQEGHIKVVRVLLAHGADINSRTANNSTPLHIASQGGDPELAKWFLNVMNSVAGASSLLKIVFFPLHLESLKGHPDSGVDFYTILLQHYREMHMNNSITNISLNSASKFDLEIAHVKCEIGRCTVANSQISNGATPLLGESSSRNIKIAQLLLDHNADVHMYDNSGNTPLHIAASGGHLEVTRILLQRNAGVNSRDDGGATPLFRASGHGHAHVVRLLLDHDADVHSRGPSRCTPLHIAAMNSHLEVARIFLERNAEINPKEDHGLTPLLLASHYGHTDVMRLLLDHNADVHVRYDTGKAKGMTPLHDAATKGHVEVTRLLLEHNAEVNSRDDSGATPLFRASENGQADVVRLLLDHDAEVHTRGYPGRTPLHMAAMNGHLEVTRILLECNAEINSQDDKRCTSLLLVSGKGHADVVRLLLDHNADVHTRGYSGCTPLHIAAMNGHLEIARILLECNAEINSKADDGWTPLIFATLDEHTDVVRLLLDRNADVHVRYDTGMTLLHKAATKGWVEVTRMLLERNAEVNSRDDSGATPLFRASQNGQADVVQLLLDHNADVHTRGHFGCTPLYIAAMNGHLEVSRILLEHNAEINSQDDHGRTPLLFASYNGHAHVVRLLLDHNADVHFRTNTGVTLLHLAAAKGLTEIARMLLECNADVNSRADYGATPLLFASQHGTPDVVQLLLDHNADQDVRDGDGDTLLHCAALGGRLEVARLLLLKLNMEVNSRNNKGSTPLHAASAGSRSSEEGYPDVVRLLLDHGADVHARNLDGQTASEVARGPRQQEIVRVLANHAQAAE